MSSRNVRRVLELLQLRHPLPDPDAAQPEPVLVPEYFAQRVNPYQELAAALDADNGDPAPSNDPEFDDFDEPDNLDSDDDPDTETTAEPESGSNDAIKPGSSSQSKCGPKDKPQPGPSDEPQSGPSTEPQPGPSHEPQPGSSFEPQPGPSGMQKRGPKRNPQPESTTRKSRRRANRRLRQQKQTVLTEELPLEDPEVADDSDEDNISPLPSDDESVTYQSTFEESDNSFIGNSSAESIYFSPGPYQNGLLEVEDTDESMSIPSLATNQRDSFYSPSPSPSVQSPTRSYDDAFEVWQVDEELAEALLAIKTHVMRVTPETRRLFGTDVHISRRRKKTPRERMLGKSIIIEFPDDLLRPYDNSLVMSSRPGPNNTIVFTFDHTPDHQRLHREFLAMLSLGGSQLLLNLDAAQRNAHVESMIEIFDSMCRDDDFTGAHHLIQVIVAVLQYASMPSFNLTDRQCRLPYKYIENRPYHIAMLKYMYLLSNKACHRIALEMCKMMFNLDPSDPLALMFVIDTFALRAREFRWLVDVLEFWSYDREANLMFNMLFSHSLAFFHLVKKSDDDTDQRFAGELLQNAIIRFPYVITAIISNISSADFRPLKQCQLYGTFAAASTSPSMRKLIDIYARLTWPRWIEPSVVTWFLHNARVMGQMYDADPEIQGTIHYYASYRARMFIGLPEEVLRHMCIIKPLSNWVLDGIEVPVVSSYDAFDPLPPPDEVDRYGYKARPPSPVPAPTHWYAFFRSMLPF